MPACINAGRFDEQMSPPALKKTVQVVPDRQPRGIPEDSPVVDRPALFVLSPAHDLELEAIVLHVHPGREDRNTIWNLGPINFPPLHQAL